MKHFLCTLIFSIVTLPAFAVEPTFLTIFGSSISDKDANKLVTRMDQLPTDGRALEALKTEALWSASYWPTSDGGIAGAPALRLSPEEFVENINIKIKTSNFDSLAPASKFDLLNSKNLTTPQNIQLPLSMVEQARVHKKSLPWEGICNGWATASIFHSMPKQVIVPYDTNKSLIFTPEDIAALLSWYYNAYPPNHKTYGKICGTLAETPCVPNSPAIFHTVIANYLGINSKPIVIDVEGGQAIWNQPIIGFTSVISQLTKDFTYRKLKLNELSESTISSNSVNQIESQMDQWRAVKTTIRFMSETKKVSRNFQDVTYIYLLKVAKNGEITDGKWLSKAPDLLWSPEKPDEVRPSWKKFFETIGYIN